MPRVRAATRALSFTLDLTEGALEYISGNFAASLARFEDSLRVATTADELAREVLRANGAPRRSPPSTATRSRWPVRASK